MRKNAFWTFSIVILGLAILGGIVALDQNDSAPLAPALKEAVSESALAPEPETVSPISTSERAALFAKFMSPARPTVATPGSRLAGAPNGYMLLTSIDVPGKNTKLLTYIPSPRNMNDDGSPADLVLERKEPAKIFLADSDGTLTKMADIDGASGANYGGIFLPQAITPDGKTVILRAWMGSPGAGGGLVDFGYSAINMSPYDHVLETSALPRLASKYAIFYDDWSKVISLEEGANAPDWAQPGRSPNQATVIYRNLMTGEKKTVAAEPETTYEFVDFDEAGKTLTIQSQKHVFGSECPAAGMTLDCSTVTATNTTISLP
jgi:hypothetical protein